jgi:predicted transcriptional regulator
MTTGPETTKYHIAASELSGTRVAARAFGATGVDFEQPAQINVFNINAPGSQNAANLEALAYSDMGAPLSFSSGAATLIQNLQKEEEEKKEREERSFQSLLDQIDADIAALERHLDDLYKERDEIHEKMGAVDALIELERLDNVDPNNPEHQRLLRKAGFNNPDKWGTLTMDDYRRHREELEGRDREIGSEITRTQTQITTLSSQRDAIERVAGDPHINDINVNGLGLDAEIARRQATNPGFDPEHVTRAEVQEIMTENVSLARAQVANIDNIATERFVRDFSELQTSGMSAEASAQLINNLEDGVAQTLLTTEGLDSTLRTPLKARAFVDAYEHEVEAHPEQRSEILSAFVQTLDAATAASLRSNPNTPREITEALSTQNAASLQASIPAF